MKPDTYESIIDFAISVLGALIGIFALMVVAVVFSVVVAWVAR